jgi:EspA/EspE family
VSVLNAFLSTWSNARQTYGEGTPQTGAQYDGSSTLNQLQSTVQTAAPGSKWTGGAANAYGAANTEHGRVLGQLAGLDQRLSAHVDQSAEVVAAGRRDLDAVRKWVVDAAASVPQNAAGERMQMAIVQKGISQVQEIIQRSNGELNSIGGKIRDLGDEYQALGNQKFGPKEGDGPLTATGDEKAEAVPPEKRAKEDVEKTLKDGDQEAAARVEETLGSIKPYQEMTPEQAAYLNEMQSQQSGMSVKDLKAAEDRLGDKGHVIGDSWQLMSNDDVPRSAGKFDEQQKGGFERLPQSVQDAIKSPGLLGDQQMKDIAAIVKDGSPQLQTGTELDREMMRKADRMMDAPMWEKSTGQPGDGSHPQYDVVLQDIFDSAGRDHQIVHDHLTGTHGDDGKDFLQDITNHEWNDDGKAAGSLFEWTKNSTGPEGQIAAETANVYADYLGTYSGDLLAIDGNRQIGDMNPEMVKAFAHGLAPYQEEMVTDQPRVDTPFHRLDELSGSLEKTKGLFAVIDSQHDAAVEWNKTAYHNALDMQQSFSAFAKEHPDLPFGDTRVDDLQSSARLLGAIDGGINKETLSNINNAEMNNQQANDAAKESYEFKRDILRSVFSYAPPGDLVNNAFADVLAGPPPELGDVRINDTTGMVSDVGLSASEQSIGYQNTQAHYAVASQFVHQGNTHIEPRFFDHNGNLLPPNRIAPADWSLYDMQLTTSMAEYTQLGPALQKFNITLGQVGGSQG